MNKKFIEKLIMAPFIKTARLLLVVSLGLACVNSFSVQAMKRTADDLPADDLRQNVKSDDEALNNAIDFAITLVVESKNATFKKEEWVNACRTVDSKGNTTVEYTLNKKQRRISSEHKCERWAGTYRLLS